MSAAHHPLTQYAPASFCLAAGIAILSSAVTLMYANPQTDAMTQEAVQHITQEANSPPVVTAVEETVSVVSDPPPPPVITARPKPQAVQIEPIKEKPAPPPPVPALPIPSDALPDIPTDAKSLISFTTTLQTVSGDNQKPLTLEWSLSDASLANNFSDFDLFFILLDSENHPGGIIGAQHITEKSIVWQIQDMHRSNGAFYSDTKKYKIRAYLQYVGRAPFTCTPTTPESSLCTPVYEEPLQSKVNAAKAYTNESELFSIRGN